MVMLGMLCAGPAAACRLALVVAVDVSSSVDADEHALQREGLARALQSPAVQDAFFASSDPVALSVIEWSGRDQQAVLVPWQLVTSQGDLLDIATSLRQVPRPATRLPTAMGHALAFSALHLRQAPTCLFQTIDVSGDGPNNQGFGPQLAYATFPFDGVTVNGLVITTTTATPLPYYSDVVRHGPLAFVEVAEGFADFGDAMERKLIRELSAQVIGRANRALQDAG